MKRLHGSGRGFATARYYSELNGYRIRRGHLATIGRTLSRYCAKEGEATPYVPDVDFGQVKSYPLAVLERHRHLFAQYHEGPPSEDDGFDRDALEHLRSIGRQTYEDPKKRVDRDPAGAIREQMQAVEDRG